MKWDVFLTYLAFHNCGPISSNLSHHLLSLSRLDPAAESSAYQTCLAMPSRRCISGCVPIAYMAIARGSPCVFPLSMSYIGHQQTTMSCFGRC